MPRSARVSQLPVPCQCRRLRKHPTAPPLRKRSCDICGQPTQRCGCGWRCVAGHQRVLLSLLRMGSVLRHSKRLSITRWPIKASVSVLVAAVVAYSPADTSRLLNELLSRPQELQPALEAFEPHTAPLFPSLFRTALDGFCRGQMSGSLLPVFLRFDVKRWLATRDPPSAERREVATILVHALAEVDPEVSGSHHQAWTHASNALVSLVSHRFPELLSIAFVQFSRQAACAWLLRVPSLPWRTPFRHRRSSRRVFSRC